MLKLDSDYGITTKGFNIRDYNSIENYVGDKLRSEDKFGADIDFSDQSTLYQISAPFMELISELWELSQQIFYSASPKYAEGVPLTATGKYIGIGRKQPYTASGIETFSGDPGTIIEQYYKISTESGVVFKTDQGGIIDSTGHIDLPITADLPGVTGNVQPNTITNIINPIRGLSSITNAEVTSKGQDEETDIDFRNKYASSTAIASGNTLDAIKAKLLNLTGVQDVQIEENDEDTEQNGIPAHSFECFIYGGANEEIAQAIFDKRPGGIKAFGSIVVDITDTQGKVFHIGFSRPTSIPIWFKITKTIDNSVYPNDGDTQMLNAILEYMQSIKLGEDIIVYKIISLISNLNLDGLLDIKVELSLDGENYSSSNQSINTEQVAITDENKVQVM